MHKVLTKRETAYPFRPYWVCPCGYVFQSTYMGSLLYKELEMHEENAFCSSSEGW